jgi:hypothetical protein
VDIVRNPVGCFGPGSDLPAFRLRRSALAFSLVLLCPLVLATTLYVSPAGDDAYDGLAPTWDGTHGPKQHIQAAITAASSGAAVIAAQGTYCECISFGGKASTVRSTDPSNASVVAA